MSKQIKLEKITAMLSNKECRGVPISDCFWTGFLNKAKEKWGNDVNVYRKFDLDYIIVNPNMDPIIKNFDIIEQSGEDIVVKTGFGATIKRSGDLPMPHFAEFLVKEPEDMENFIIESGSDSRRITRSGDDQINGLGDAIAFNIASWNDRVDDVCNDFPVFGSVCEAYEYVWRCVGTENALSWMLLEPELFERFIVRISDFVYELAKLQIDNSNGRLSGMYIWGDVAYVNGMMFSPEIWRKWFKPIVKRVIDLCHANNLMVIYHGCGNATSIYEDLIEIGLDGYNPLEVKAHLDIVKLKEKFGGRLAFVGNIDVRELESGDRNRIKREVLYKLQAAQGGGWICQSDHSISSDVEPESYAYMVTLIREYGNYPLELDKIKAEILRLDELLKL